MTPLEKVIEDLKELRFEPPDYVVISKQAWRRLKHGPKPCMRGNAHQRRLGRRRIDRWRRNLKPIIDAAMLPTEAASPVGHADIKNSLAGQLNCLMGLF